MSARKMEIEWIDGTTEIRTAVERAANRLRNYQEWMFQPDGHNVPASELFDVESELRAAISAKPE